MKNFNPGQNIEVEQPFIASSRRITEGNIEAMRRRRRFFKRDTGKLVWSEKYGRMVLRAIDE